MGREGSSIEAAGLLGALTHFKSGKLRSGTMEFRGILLHSIEDHSNLAENRPSNLPSIDFRLFLATFDWNQPRFCKFRFIF
ncbi:hypothetical protein M408DRAFT_326791 [Serendipita vermifera MAFF 305830]|uniref:Uncharacterized protein n=1 Tax=Serendipita vermifera MAFF 305830 TaxID=933852 RepID=A0A0C3BJ80_SERVB|nr:hypothetical protein M408DRAFT_326791 [Serendipita vermifera MAFF 305830]